MNKKEGPGKPKTINSLGDLKKLPIKTVAEKPQISEKAEQTNKNFRKREIIFADKSEEYEKKVLAGARELEAPSASNNDNLEIKLAKTKKEAIKNYRRKNNIAFEEGNEEFNKDLLKDAGKIESQKAKGIEVEQYGIKDSKDLKNREEEYNKNTKEVGEKIQEEIKVKKIFEGKGIEKIDLKTVKWPPENSEALESVRKTVESFSLGEALDIEEHRALVKKELEESNKKWSSFSSNEIAEKQELFKKFQNFPEQKYVESAFKMLGHIDKNNPESVEKLQYISEEFMTSNTSKESKEKFWDKASKIGRDIDSENSVYTKSFGKAAKTLEKEKMLRENGGKIKKWSDSEIAKWGYGFLKAAPVFAAAGVAAYAALKFIGPFYGWYKFVFKPEWDKANKGKK